MKTKYIIALFGMATLLMSSCEDKNKTGDDPETPKQIPEVGAVYTAEDGTKGVVFSIKTKTKAEGVQVNDIFMISAEEVEMPWATEMAIEEEIRANGDDGLENCKNILEASEVGINNYPALQWCVNLNVDKKFSDKGWYLPSKEELRTFFLIYYGIDQGKVIGSVDLEKKRKFDEAFVKLGGKPITILDTRENKPYWTSNTDYDNGSGTSWGGFYFATDVNWGSVANIPVKNNKTAVKYVRAVRHL